MASSFKYLILGAIALTIISACNNNPKVITPTEDINTEKIDGIFTPDPSTQVTSNPDIQLRSELHQVVVQEVLPTAKYVYLKVTEGSEPFWIAARKQEVKKGGIYFYRGGLLKTNFESKEYNRVFEKIYLISNLVAENHANNTEVLPKSNSGAKQKNVVKEDIPTHTDKIVEHKGTLKIADLIKDPKKYEGNTVQLSGECVKVNPNIMNRTWIHLKDGSQDDFDLVITSDSYVPKGSVITIRAVVGLNRDFGAGYKYDLILENGILVQ